MFDCEYRQDGDVRTLQIGGQATDTKITRVSGDESLEIEGAGVIKAKRASLWLAERGTGKTNVRTYDSLDAALRGEKAWIQRVFYNGGGIDMLAAFTGLRPPNDLPMPEIPPPPSPR